MKKTVTIVILCLAFSNILTIFSDEGLCENTNDYIHVGGDGQVVFITINDAINFSNNGDTIFIHKGEYFENVVINKSINLIGEDKDLTIISNNYGVNTLTIDTEFVNISGFTIKGGTKSSIFINYSIQIFVYNNSIIDNSGYGIYISNNSEADISKNNTFYHNNFINNTQNIFEGDQNNIWSYQNQGNYYDDYEGLDKNNDGIGDSPYNISTDGSIDQYPLMMPYVGKIRIKEFFVDYGELYKMLIIGLVVAIVILLPIGYFWYKKFIKQIK